MLTTENRSGTPRIEKVRAVTGPGYPPCFEYFVYRGDELVRVCPSEGMAREVAAGVRMTNKSQGVRPIPPSLCVYAPFERRIIATRMVANQNDYREAERKALGGKIGTAVLVFVAVFLGVLLATGGVL